MKKYIVLVLGAYMEAIKKEPIIELVQTMALYINNIMKYRKELCAKSSLKVIIENQEPHP